MTFGSLPGITKAISRMVYGTLCLHKAEEPFKLLDGVVAAGCNTFDVAGIYGNGECERILGDWIQCRRVRDNIVIATKGGCGDQDTLWAATISPAQLKEQLMASLQRLRVPSVDLYMLHRDDPSMPVSDIVDMMDRFIGDGFMHAWGVSNWTLPRLAAAVEYAKLKNKASPVCDSLQTSLAKPAQSVWPGTEYMTEERAEWYVQNDIAVFAWECLAKGFLAGSWGSDITESRLANYKIDVVDDPNAPDFRKSRLEQAYVNLPTIQRRDRVKILAKSKGVDMGEVALSYVLAQKYNSFVLVGTTKIEHFKSNASSTALALTQPEVDYLRSGSSLDLLSTAKEALDKAPNNLVVAIVGAGAIGVHMAYILDKVGVRVTLIAHGDTKKAIETNGVRVTMPDGTTHASPCDVTDDPACIGPVDYVLITVPTFALGEIVTDIQPLLGPRTVVVPPSTSLPYWWFHKDAKHPERQCDELDASGALWAAFPPERVIGMTYSICAEAQTPGHSIVRHVEDGYILGEPDGALYSHRALRLSKAFQAGGVPAPLVDDIRSHIWSGALCRLAFSLVAALGDASQGQIADSPKVLDIVRGVFGEGQAVAEVMQIPLPLLSGRRAWTWSGHGFPSMEEQIQTMLTNRGHTMSLARDMHAGQRLEIGDVHHSFKAFCALTGVATPIIDTMVSLVHLRAQGFKQAPEKSLKRKGCPENDTRQVKRAMVTASKVKHTVWASKAAMDTVIAARSAIGNVLDGKDDRVIAIVGPCSIHDPDAAMVYAKKLVKVAEQHAGDLVVVMRVYFEKPRTTVGWKGLINDPDLDGSCDIQKGLEKARRLLVAINEMGLPAATEFLDMITPNYIADMVSWGAIGARTTESQSHREMASGLPLPIGFKNGTSGDCQVAVDAIGAAQGSHCFLGVGEDGMASECVSSGNRHAHLILRGGKDGPNLCKQSVENAAAAVSKANLTPQIVIDVSHANSNKNHKNQLPNVDVVASQISTGCQVIKGLMIESNLTEGAQKLSPGKTDLTTLKYGQSVTDACIGWEETEACLQSLAEAVQSRRFL